MSCEPDFGRIREDFPTLRQNVHGFPLVYLDNAATTQKPQSVLDEIGRYYAQDNSNVHRAQHELSNRATVAFEQARVDVARYLNAPSADNIVFTRGTTEAINLVANAWGNRFLKENDTILLTEMEHHSNLVPWQLLAERVGAKIEFVPVLDDQGLLDLEVAEKKLAQGPKIFAFTHVSNTLGTINPVCDLIAIARKNGVVTLVDGAQSAGHLPVDVQALDCDFLAFSGHKACGPTGSGILYGKAEILASMPPWQGGGEMIGSVSYDKASYKKPPQRFEAGTPDIAGAIGLGTSLNYVDKVGRSAIFAHDQALAQNAYEQLQSIPGIRLLGPVSGRAGLVTFALAEAHAHDVVMLADQRGVALRGGHHCNQPLMRKLGLAASVRASFYFYNTAAEVDRLVEVMHEVQRFFSR